MPVADGLVQATGVVQPFAGTLDTGLGGAYDVLSLADLAGASVVRSVRARRVRLAAAAKSSTYGSARHDGAGGHRAQLVDRTGEGPVAA